MDCIRCNNQMVKNGKTIVGSQKYLCKQCGFMCTPHKKGYDVGFKRQVLDSLHSGVPKHKVAKEFGIDKKTVQSWVNDKAIVDLYTKL